MSISVFGRMAAALSLAALLAWPGAGREPLGGEQRPQRGDALFTSYTDAFDRFARDTVATPDAERVRLFRARFATVFPGFYAPRERTETEFESSILRALQDYPAIRDRYLAAAQTFGAAFARGNTRFRTFFPDYRLTVPVYLVHSLGEMDGGGRTIEGRDVMVFGADVIAQIHDPDTIGPFLDHELFHVYHSRFFADCDQLWCALWREGLATYVAERMNPGATDRQLLLTSPMPLRAAVEPHLAEAVCLARAKMDSTDDADLRPFFQGGASPGAFPPRFGYYVGYRIARQIGGHMSLAALARLTQTTARPRIERAMRDLGGCR
jgi:hypothetical protein